MKWLAKAFDARDASIDIPSVLSVVVLTSYIVFAAFLLYQGKFDLLAFSAGAVPLIGAFGASAWGVAKAREADPAFPTKVKTDAS